MPLLGEENDISKRNLSSYPLAMLNAQTRTVRYPLSLENEFEQQLGGTLWHRERRARCTRLWPLRRVLALGFAWLRYLLWRLQIETQKLGRWDFNKGDDGRSGLNGLFSGCTSDGCHKFCQFMNGLNLLNQLMFPCSFGLLSKRIDQWMNIATSGRRWKAWSLNYRKVGSMPCLTWVP